MTERRARVRVAANFESNLQEIEAFWMERDVRTAYPDLLESLAATVVTNLERFPRIGRAFLGIEARSLETARQVASFRASWPDADLREYLTGDYVILYAIADEANPADVPTVHLLAIRHHRQLSFDLPGFWPDGPR